MNNENQIIKCTRCHNLKSITEYTINIKTNILYKCCEHCREYRKQYYKENSEYEKDYSNKYHLDIKNRIRSNVNNRILSVIKNKLPDYKIYLGCDITDYLTYLESKFKDGMSWDTYGTLWNIDHIRPLKPKVKISQEETIKRLHYSNTQPLYCIENMIKTNKETIQDEICKNFENKLKEEQEEKYAEIVFIDEDENDVIKEDNVINTIIDTYL